MKIPKPAWSYGMQSRARSRVGAAPAIAEAVEEAHKLGITEAVVFGKDHTGFCFYPTKEGVPHPKLQVDLMGIMTEELHKRGMTAIAYVNLGMDGEAGRRRPEWLMRSPTGGSYLVPEHFGNLCLYSGYLDDYLLPVMKEMVETCHVDGFFLDTMSAFRRCFCEKCRALYREYSGKEIPVELDDPELPAYGLYKKKLTAETVERIRAELLAVNPELKIIFNHEGGPLVPWEIPGLHEVPVSGDPRACYPWPEFMANYLSSFEVTGDVFIERFQRGWGDRCGCSNETMTYKTACISAYGQRFCVGDRMHPECRMAPGSGAAMKRIVGTVDKINALLPDGEMPLEPEFIALFPSSTIFGRNWEFFGTSGRFDFAKPGPLFFGLPVLLADAGFPFMIAPEMTFADHLRPDRLLIVSGAIWLDGKSDEAIRKFLLAGGKVLFAETLPRLTDGKVPDYLGVEAGPEPWQRAVYLPPWRKSEADEEKTLCAGDILDLKLAGARPVLYGYPQYDFTLMGGGYNSCAAEKAEVPLLTVNRYGKGKVWFLNAPVFTEYTDRGVELLKWTRTLLKKLHAPESELVTSAGGLELVSRKSPDGKKRSFIILHHGGLRHSLRGGPFTMTEQVIIPRPQVSAVLRVKTSGKLRVTVNGRRAAVRQRSGFAELRLTINSSWTVVNMEEV